MEYHEFLQEVQKPGSKPHTISHCLGSRDAWKWVRKSKWKPLKGYRCSSSLYSEIINEMNLYNLEQLLAGHQVILPHQMGALELIGVSPKVSFEEGSVKSNYRIDWQKTLQYWYEERDARVEKKLVKRVQGIIPSLRYSKKQARYKNQKFYQFRPNRSVVRLLGRKAENEKINALIY